MICVLNFTVFAIIKLFMAHEKIYMYVYACYNYGVRK